MTKQQFTFQFVDKKHGVGSFNLTETISVNRKPLYIYDSTTEKYTKFKTIDELLNYQINGISVWDMIKERDNLYPDLNLWINIPYA